MATEDELKIEARIQELQLNAPRLTPALIDACIADETFVVMPDERTTVCQLTLRNGFTVRGESSVVSKENFRQDLGQEISRRKARDTIWLLEAYLLQQRIYEQAIKELA